MWRFLTIGAFVGFLPLLGNMAVNLWSRDAYGFFPLAWAGGVGLWWLRLRAGSGDAALGVSRRRISAVVMCLAVAAMGGAVAIWSPWLGLAGSILLMAAISFRVEGRAAWRNSAVPLLLLVLTLPPPVDLDRSVMVRLKEVAVGFSSRFLDLLGIVHAKSGVVIELPGMQMLLEDACSGINSLMAVVAMALFLVIAERRRWWHGLLVVAFAVGVVVVANTARITLGGWAWARHGKDLLHGTPHLILGSVLFAAEIVFVLSFDRFLCFFTMGVKRTPSGAVVAPPRSALLGGRRGSEVRAVESTSGPVLLLPRTVVSVLVLLGGICAVRGAVRWREPKSPAPVMGAGSALSTGKLFELPAKVSGWEQIPGLPPEQIEAEADGLFSDRWRYRLGELQVTVAIDYPFTHYHDLAWCYEVAGWTRTAREILPSLNADLPGAAHLALTRRGFERSEILFSSVNEKGVWQDNSRMLDRDETDTSFWSRLLARIRPRRYEGDGLKQFRVQLYWKGVTPLLLDDRRRMQQLFEAACLAAAAQLTGPAEPAPVK